MKQSKTQYQVIRIRKLFFETLDLSKHLMKNLQFTINVISDKEDEVKDPADTKDQLLSSSSQVFSEIPSNRNKRKKKDTGNQ